MLLDLLDGEAFLRVHHQDLGQQVLALVRDGEVAREDVVTPNHPLQNLHITHRSSSTIFQS